MKRKIFARYFLLIGAIISSSILVAQVVPNASTGPSGVSGVHIAPSAYNSTMPVNFVRTWDASKPLTLESDVTASGNTIDISRQTTQYFDGLGRPLQIVVKKVTPGGRDMVTPFVYDDFSREEYKYLPYSPIDSNTNNGLFKQNPFNEQATFFSNTTYNPGANGEQVYYSRTVFESSALSRIDTQYAQGNSWAGSYAGIKSQYLINTLADSVRVWNISFTQGSTPTSTAYYSAGTLYKTVTADEQGKQTIEYKDLDGHSILKKVQIAGSPSSHHTGWLCTYYVYDDLNNLRFVIQPRGTDTLKSRGWVFESSSWNTSAIAKELCFSYEYDDLHRIIIKRVPGAGETWMVYDARDRMVMSQDSNLRLAGQWLVTKYDTLNRPFRTYTWNNSSNRTTHQAAATNSTNYPVLSGTYDSLTVTYYDDYSWTSSAGLSSTFINTYSGNTTYFYSASNSTFPYPQAITPYYITNGMTTGTKIKVLGSANTYLYAVNFYDDRARMIGTQTINFSGAKDTVTMQYSFDGKLLRNLLCHSKNSPNAQRYIVLTKTDYDGAGRLIKVSKAIGNSPETVIAESSYDEAGRLLTKKLGRERDAVNQNTYTSNAIDSLQSNYNIRGWLSSINKNFANASNSNNWFGMILNYDFGFTQTQLNGNIAGIRWRSKGDGEQRAYGFSYDTANRFLKADFTQYTGGWNTSAGIDFTVSGMSYDANGNILTMNQSGWKLGGSVTIDSLLYTYNTGSNKLLNVLDRKNDTATVLGDFRSSKRYMTLLGNNKTTSATDYTYDGNGNLKLDNNKDITYIRFNYLNLPDSIRIYGKGIIRYVYDASGIKLAKITIDSTVTPVKTTTTTYLGNFVYQNDSLQFMTDEEGRTRPKRMNYSDTMYYDYFEKDHLGNVRVMLTDQLQTDAYPPASLETANLPTERLYYSKVDSGRVNKSTVTGYPTDNYTSPNDYIQKLNGNGVKVGTGIVLKVMAGDQFNLRVSSWWTGSSPGTPVSPLNDIIAALASGVAGVTGGHPSSTDLTNSGVLSPNVTSFLNSRSYNSSLPKAYVNWILFDERFNYVSSSSGFQQVGSSGTFTVHTLTNSSISKSGYLYVYVSNETPNIDVFFDNLQVTQIRGPLIEETHYYPFGLTMSGISSKALNFGDPGNKYKYNGGSELQNKEFSDGSGLELYATNFRSLDPQLGRWWQVDPKIEDNQFDESPYQSMDDDPESKSDPDGDESNDCCKWLGDAWHWVAERSERTWEETEKPLLQKAWSNLKNNAIGIAQQVLDNPLSAVAIPEGEGLNLTEQGSKVEVIGLKGSIKLEVKGTKQVAAESSNVNETAKVNSSSNNSTTSSSSSKGLGNPFKDKTLKEVRNNFDARVKTGTMEKKGPNAYVNKKSGYSYNVDKGGNYGRGGRKIEQPHIDVNYPNPKPKNVPPKKKLSVANE